MSSSHLPLPLNMHINKEDELPLRHTDSRQEHERHRSEGGQCHNFSFPEVTLRENATSGLYSHVSAVPYLLQGQKPRSLDHPWKALVRNGLWCLGILEKLDQIETAGRRSGGKNAWEVASQGRESELRGLG